MIVLTLVLSQLVCLGTATPRVKAAGLADKELQLNYEGGTDDTLKPTFSADRYSFTSKQKSGGFFLNDYNSGNGAVAFNAVGYNYICFNITQANNFHRIEIHNNGTMVWRRSAWDAEGRPTTGVTVADISALTDTQKSSLDFMFVMDESNAQDLIMGGIWLTNDPDALQNTLVGQSISGISLKCAPFKTQYTVGESLDLTGGEITVHYTNGNTQDLAMTSDMVGGFDSGTPADQQPLTVTYYGHTATFDVSVSQYKLAAKNPLIVNRNKTQIVGISPGTSASGLQANLTSAGGTVHLDNLPSNGNVGTGTQVQLLSQGQVIDQLTATVYGDVNGDGVVDINDLAAIKKHLLGETALEGSYAAAADVFNQSSISINDLLAVKEQLLGISTINQNPEGLLNKTQLTASDITTFGRTYFDSSNNYYMNWTASGFEISVDAPTVSVDFTSDASYPTMYEAYVTVIVDGQQDSSQWRVIPVSPQGGSYVVADHLSPGTHTIQVLKRSEVGMAKLAVTGVEFPDGGKLLAPPADTNTRKIEVIGDSITCGFGDMAPDSGTAFTTQYEDGLHTYATIAARALNADINVTAQSGYCIWKSTNGPAMPQFYDQICGINSYNTAAWDFTKYQPDVIVLNLGTNDNQIASDADQATFEQAYTTFLNHILSVNPSSKVICCIAPMMTDPTARNYVGVQNAYNTVKQTDTNNRLSFLTFTNYNTYPGDIRSGHPGQQTHAQDALDLENAIRAITGWN